MKQIDNDRYVFFDQSGDATLTKYQVFPGVQLIYSDVHVVQLAFEDGTREGVIVIHYCHEGRMEQDFGDQLFYLMPGDLSIGIKNREVKSFQFPVQHYHGITIIIDAEQATQSFSQFLEDVDVSPMLVVKKLCQENHYFILRAKEQIGHIFSELYSIPEHIKKGYLKIKVLELLLVLSSIENVHTCTLEKRVSKEQAQIAKEAATYLTEHLVHRIPISCLAKRFSVSDTYLKNVFKAVYGVPIYSYIRVKKMQLAASRLIQSEDSILEIANEFGYNNGSKFTAAFREVMGETPSEYRKYHRKK